MYGTTGDFGPAFLTALNIKTGQSAWQHRGFGRASLVYADGKLIIMDEDGDLALARVSPENVTILSQAKIFETTTWTTPTLVGTTLYARDREKIVALDLGAGATREGARAPNPATPASTPAPAAAPSGAADARASRQPSLVVQPSLAGTWRLNAAQSRVMDAAGISGLIGAGAPPMLHITQPANGTVVVESPINEGHVRIYHPGARTATPVGQGGTITVTSEVVARTLVAQGTVVNASGAATAVKEIYSVSGDAQVLTVEVTTAGSGESTSLMKYSRISDVGPCEQWPTPCKRQASDARPPQ